MNFKQSQLKKIVRVLLTLLVIASIPSQQLHAAEQIGSSAEYDICVGGTQHFSLANDDGSIHYVTITQLPGNSRIANGVYQIDHTSPGAWKAGYKVKISNNTFLSAYDAYYKPITGSITSAKLVKNNSSHILYHFTYQSVSLTTFTGVQSKISNGILKVSRL